jgi:hypothetical protein
VCAVRVGGRELVAPAGDDGTMRLWDPATGTHGIAELASLLSRFDLRPAVAVAELATSLAAAHRLRAADALHVATAVAAGADRFITNNRRDCGPSITEVEVFHPDALGESARPVRSSDDPPAQVAWSLGGGHQLGWVAGADRAGSDDPAVQRHEAGEIAADTPEYVEVLRPAVAVDAGDDAPLARGVHADERVTDRNGRARPVEDLLGRHPVEDDVGTQSAHVERRAVAPAECIELAVDGDEVGDVEALRGLMSGGPALRGRRPGRSRG